MLVVLVLVVCILGLWPFRRLNLTENSSQQIHVFYCISLRNLFSQVSLSTANLSSPLCVLAFVANWRYYFVLSMNFKEKEQ